MPIIFCIPIYIKIQVLTLIEIFVVWVSAAIVLILYQMPRQTQMSSVCTRWYHHPETSEVEVLHMPHTWPNELCLLLVQYCQLSKPLQEENDYNTTQTKIHLHKINNCDSIHTQSTSKWHKHN